MGTEGEMGMQKTKVVAEKRVAESVGPTGNPRRGRRQQPHHSLKKFEKYKGGKKRHTMVAQSSPKMPK
jgi:hypothetical protein